MVVKMVKQNNLVVIGNDRCLAVLRDLRTVPPNFRPCTFVVLVEPVPSNQKHGLSKPRCRELWSY